MARFGRRNPEESTETLPVLVQEDAPFVSAAPRVNATEAAIAALRAKVMDEVDPLTALSLSSSELRQRLEGLVNDVAERDRVELSVRDQARIAEDLTHEILGYGPLEPLLRDETVNDIMVNGPRRVFIERAGKVYQTDVTFRDSRHVAAIAQRMAAVAGRRVDESTPLVDCRLADGSRVNVVFHPLALDGPYISIRKFAKRKIDLQAMVANGSISPQISRILEIAARCRLNIVISGGTGSGKTTLLNALSQLIDAAERVVTIEDAAELQLQQPHVVRMETRPANLEGKGEITQRDLVKNALRMRPDRIILGEVRAGEAFEMLQAMNTGHDGSICTVHANTARDALTRIENMVQMGMGSLTTRSIRTQVASAIDLVIQIERMRDGQRRIVQVSEVCGLEGDIVTMNDFFTFEYDSEDSTGRISGRYLTSTLRPSFSERLRYFGLERAWMQTMQDA